MRRARGQSRPLAARGARGHGAHATHGAYATQHVRPESAPLGNTLDDARAGLARVGPRLRDWAAHWWPVGLELTIFAVVLVAMRIAYATLYHAHEPPGDVMEYQRYAIQFWLDHPRFTHLPVEYPPLAILPFTLTVVPPLRNPETVFVWWMIFFTLVGYLWMRLRSTRARAITYAVYLVIGTAGTLLLRFDLFPALATLLALQAAERRRFTRAYVWIAVGILLKLYPAFFVPLVAVAQWRDLRARARLAAPELERASAHASAAGPEHAGTGIAAWAGRWRDAKPSLAALATRLTGADARVVGRGIGTCAGITVLGFGLAAILSPSGVISGFVYAGMRPLQIESTPATLQWLGTFVGFPALPVHTYKSLNLVGPLTAPLKSLSMLGLVIGCAAVYWRQLVGRLNVGQAFVATVCVVIVANKIFSPQYLIWLLPLVAYVAGFDLIWVAIGALTTFIFPQLYFSYAEILDVPHDPRFLPAVALRNTLLLFVTVRAIMGSPTASSAPGRSDMPPANGVRRSKPAPEAAGAARA